MPAIASHLKIQLEPSPSTTEGFSFPLFDRGMRGMIRSVTCWPAPKMRSTLRRMVSSTADSSNPAAGATRTSYRPLRQLGYLCLPHSRKVVDDQRRQRYRPSVGGGEGIFDPPVDRAPAREMTDRTDRAAWALGRLRRRCGTGTTENPNCVAGCRPTPIATPYSAPATTRRSRSRETRESRRVRTFLPS